MKINFCFFDKAVQSFSTLVLTGVRFRQQVHKDIDTNKTYDRAIISVHAGVMDVWHQDKFVCKVAIDLTLTPKDSLLKPVHFDFNREEPC